MISIYKIYNVLAVYQILCCVFFCHNIPYMTFRGITTFCSKIGPKVGKNFKGKSEVGEFRPVSPPKSTINGGEIVII